MVEKINLIEGCTVLLWKNWLTDEESYIKNCKKIDYLEGKTSFGQGRVPRLQKYFNNDNIYFSEVWRKRFPRWEANPYPDWLSDLQEKVSSQVGETYNSSLINYYRNGNDSMRPHKDDQPGWGDNPIISSLSLGDSREFIFEPINYDKENPRSMKSCKERKSISVVLNSGDLLVMKGNTQKLYKHSIPKSDSVNERWNITFRKII